MIREGMKAQVLPNDAAGNSSYVDQRKYGRESIAIVFLLEHLLGTTGGSTYKSLTERQSAYISNCLSRWVSKIEDECYLKLLSGRQKDAGNFSYKMDTSVLFKHDRMALAQYTSSLRQQSMISGNEARKLHGFDPVPDLEDDYAMGSAGNAQSDEEKAVPEKPNETESKEESDEAGN